MIVFIDKCASNPCKNKGVCTDGDGDDYTCQCAAGFKGKNCEQGKFLVYQYNHGTACLCLWPNFCKHWKMTPCVILSHFNKNISSCSDMFQNIKVLRSGILILFLTTVTCFDCLEIKACESGPCKNGATCTDVSPGVYSCNCAQGFTGSDCEQGWYKALSICQGH